MTKPLAAGDKAPKFTLADADGAKVSLADFAGQKLVLYFYPKADTPGCTTEAMDFSRLAKAFAKANAAVIGVSADPVAKLDRFRTKHDLTIPLLSDERHTMLEAYGVWGQKSFMGKKFMGIIRSHFLINEHGNIADAQVKVSPQESVERAVAALG